MYLKYKFYNEDFVIPRWEICKFVGICFHEEKHIALIALEDGFQDLIVYVNEMEYQELVDEIYKNIPNGCYCIDKYVFVGVGNYQLNDKEEINKLIMMSKKIKNKFW